MAAVPARWLLERERESSTRERQDILARAEQERGWAQATVEAAVARADGLAAMLDEIRARETQTAPPPAVTKAPVEEPLTKELQRELDAIEDEEGRAEFSELVRAAVRRRPDAPTAEIVAEVFGG